MILRYYANCKCSCMLIESNGLSQIRHIFWYTHFCCIHFFFKILRRIVIGVFDYFASNQNSEIDTQENPIEPLNPRLSPYKTRNC